MNTFLSLSLCTIISTVTIVHALPPIESRDLPNVGEDCAYHWPGHNREYRGIVTKTDDCKDGVSFWQYGASGRDTDVQCCVRQHCTAYPDPDGEYAQYSCLNTYKTDGCGGGSGKFVAGHCLGDETVQCCHDQLTYTSSTTYNSPDYNTGGQDTQAVQPVDEGNGRIGIIVPTTTSPTSASDRDSKSIEVPAVREGSTSSSATSEESAPFHYGKQSDNTYIVPTVSGATETPKEALGWRIIPNTST